MPSFDRTEGGLVKMLLLIWPELEGMSSSEVQTFLNQQTGCAVTNELPNGTAFDIWRPAIARQTEHKHVWPYTQEHIEQMRAKQAEMKADEIERQRKLKDGPGIPETPVGDSQ